MLVYWVVVLIVYSLAFAVPVIIINSAVVLCILCKNIIKVVIMIR